ncbi:uncharacterized protein TNCV_4138581 [Trichonephila clavipes]|nr:uncharacterized protein TNCV_4138581 [Trichonephila clavipes]
MTTHPGQTITSKSIRELFRAAYLKAATVRNAMKRFKERGIEPHNPLVFSEHGFAAAKTTDHDVVGDSTEINDANPQTLILENQHVNPPEESELIVNTFYTDFITKDVDATVKSAVRTLIHKIYIIMHVQRRVRIE